MISWQADRKHPDTAKMPLLFYTVLRSKYCERMRTLAKMKKLVKILKTMDFWAFQIDAPGPIWRVWSHRYCRISRPYNDPPIDASVHKAKTDPALRIGLIAKFRLPLI